MSQWPEPPPDSPRCPKCGYDLAGLSAERCPECGTNRTEYLVRRARRARRIRISLLIAFALLLVVGGWFARLLVRTVHEIELAETRLQAVRVVCDIIRSHAERHTPEWPRSWDDLKAWSREESADPYGTWTMDAPLESDVVIDFKTTLDQLCSDASAETTALRPTPGHANYNCDYLVAPLLRTICELRRSPGPEGGRPDPPQGRDK